MSLPLNKFLAWLLRRIWFPAAFQALGLVIYLGLIWFSLGVVTPQSQGSKFFAQNNIVTLTVWGIWLPFLIVTTVFLGRVWCMVCPLEFVNKYSGRIGRALGIRKLTLPRAFSTGAISAVIYILLLYLVISTRFPRVPGNVALLLGSLLLAAILSGLLLRDGRVFCKVICPAAMLLRVYGRRGLLHIGRRESDGESGTGERPCACPNGLKPGQLKDSSNCTLCGQCVKTCQRQGIVLLVRSMPSVPRAAWEDFGWVSTLFAFFLSGFVVEEMFHPWEVGEYYYNLVPETLNRALRIGWLSGHIKGIWSMVVVPGVLWLLIGLLGRAFNPSLPMKEIWKRISLPITTVVISAQLVRAFTKFSHWVTSFPSAFDGWLHRLQTHPMPYGSVGVTLPETSEGAAHVHLFGHVTIITYALVVGLLFAWFALCEARVSGPRGFGLIVVSLALGTVAVSVIPWLA